MVAMIRFVPYKCANANKKDKKIEHLFFVRESIILVIMIITYVLMDLLS